MKRIVLVLAAITVVGTASAQEAAKPSTDTQTPAVATPDTQNPAAPVAGENSFTEGQAKQRIEDKGYTDITALTKGEDGIWAGTAMKSGKPYEVKLDYQGNITEAAK